MSDAGSVEEEEEIADGLRDNSQNVNQGTGTGPMLFENRYSRLPSTATGHNPSGVYPGLDSEFRAYPSDYSHGAVRQLRHFGQQKREAPRQAYPQVHTGGTRLPSLQRVLRTSGRLGTDAL